MPDFAILTFCGFELSSRRRTLARDGHGVRVGSRAMDMLLLLAGRAGELVTKEEIQQHLWPGIFVDDISIRVHISALRKALGVDGVEHIHTVAGRGYMFVSEITRTVEAEPPPLAESHSRLPTRLERLIGRAASVESIATQLLERRFVTVIGPGGIGKTSVALEVAARRTDSSDGVRFVDFATLEDPETAPGALALALGLSVLSDLSAKLLAGKRMLIVLDNCERQADVAARVAETLLRGAEDLCVLATSREALRAEGEWLHRLPPLSTPPPREATPSAALQHSAIELFVDRVDASAGGYRLTEDDCAHVVEICRRLDGLPLAIELAATTVAALGIRAVAEGLDDRLALLTGGRRTAQSRHQTLRAAHDWSYELLSADERRVLNSLSVVAGNFDIALAGAVANNPHTSQDQIRGLVGALSGKSLIAIESASHGARYRLLESTRAYALEKLQVDDGEHRAAQNYAQATLTFFLGAAAELTKLGAAAWLARHASRLEDARAALEWAFSAEGDRALARALTAEVSTIWLNMGLVRECLSWCRQALAPGQSDNAPDAAEMGIRHAYGVAHSFMYGTSRNSRDNIASILEIARRLGDHDYAIRALWSLASVELNEGHLERALHHSAQLRDAATGPAGAADRLVGERIYGSALHLLGRHAEARGILQSARDAYAIPSQRASVTRFQYDQLVLAQGFLAMIAWIYGDETGAAQTAEAAVAEAERVEHAGSLGFALDNAITIAILRGDLEEADRGCARLGRIGAKAGLEVWMPRGEMLRAIVQVRSGDLTDGVPRLQAALAEPFRRLATYRAPLYLAKLAQAELTVGMPERALASIHDAIDWFRGEDAFWCAPECFRVKAEVLRLNGGPKAAREAETLFDRALKVAEAHGAAAWERRILRSRREQVAALQIGVEL